MDDTRAPGTPGAPAVVPWLVSLRLILVLAVLVVVFALALIGMVAWHVTHPVKEKEPVYIEFMAAGDNFVRLTAAGEDIRANAVLVAREIRNYVRDRETVDKTTEGDRFPRVMALSGDGVAKRFKEANTGNDALWKRPGFKRVVKVTRDTSLGAGIHQVEFTTEDRMAEFPNDPPSVRSWIATMRYEFKDQKVSHDRGLLNPMGLVFEEYTITMRSQ